MEEVEDVGGEGNDGRRKLLSSVGRDVEDRWVEATKDRSPCGIDLFAIAGRAKSERQIIQGEGFIVFGEDRC